MTKKIIFSGGGTGGHIFPAINLMKHFYEKKYEVLLVTDNRGSNFIKNYSEFKLYILKTGTPTNRNLIKKIFSYFLIFYSILKSIIMLKKEKPDLIFGFGGYVSFTICFESRFLYLHLIIYENNMILGRANKYLVSISKKILLAKQINENFSREHRSKTFEVGSILNKDIINYSRNKKNNNENIFSILILGGSQGAEVFGKVVPEVIKMIKEKGHEITVYQQCILNQKDIISNFYNKHKIKNYVFEFDKNILKFILSSSLAITRCGASTTAELVHTFTPFIAVPLPNSIDNHQYLNAKYYETRGCCWLLEQNNFNIKNLYDLIIEAITNKEKMKNIRLNMEKNYTKDVYSNIENQIKEFI